jgi:transposase-like protein
MPEILIRCPSTQKQLATGIALAAEEFSQATLENLSVYCPFCRQEHHWSKKDAFLRR